MAAVLTSSACTRGWTMMLLITPTTPESLRTALSATAR